MAMHDNTSVVHIALSSWLYELMAIHGKCSTHCTKLMVVRNSGYT
jgi:hypothetical protein